MSDGMRFTIRVENNSRLVISELEKATERALYAIGVKAVEGATDAISGKYNVAAAVDTGRLRASMSAVTYSGDKINNGFMPPENAKTGDKLSGNSEKNSVVVGSNVEYAEKVHNGDSKMEGRPFLREGIDRTKDDMQRQVEKIFKGQL